MYLSWQCQLPSQCGPAPVSTFGKVHRHACTYSILTNWKHTYIPPAYRITFRPSAASTQLPLQAGNRLPSQQHQQQGSASGSHCIAVFAVGCVLASSSILVAPDPAGIPPRTLPEVLPHHGLHHESEVDSALHPITQLPLVTAFVSSSRDNASHLTAPSTSFTPSEAIQSRHV